MLHIGKYWKTKKQIKCNKQLLFFLRPQTLFVSTCKLNIIGNSFESYFHSCTEILTASRSYTEIFFSIHLTWHKVVREANATTVCGLRGEHCLTLHTFTLCLLTPGCFYILSYCTWVCIQLRCFIQYMSTYIYNTVALIKNNSTVLF